MYRLIFQVDMHRNVMIQLVKFVHLSSSKRICCSCSDGQGNYYRNIKDAIRNTFHMVSHPKRMSRSKTYTRSFICRDKTFEKGKKHHRCQAIYECSNYCQRWDANSKTYRSILANRRTHNCTDFSITRSRRSSTHQTRSSNPIPNEASHL